nr:uncharacterized mitochondrial protein AtMg00810-like [Tanacetum cinerariifolium]
MSILQVVQIVLWYLDSGCLKHMIGDRKRLINFVEKFIGTVRFGNDQIFRYLRGTINMGLWYSKDSGFALTAFADADYVVSNILDLSTLLSAITS